ncbi:hypothetical protein [Clostridium sp. DJ247]|uniref:hypothetical protein n=1 Tax=Clostridium sp. DJ247 TaxID=2726188 RepID=UPI00162441FC|nr:hypothetical protein [Clostridium sp. DJ247]MBC2578749.1 hypothetical protein [Clostridium sp. DJ247]
MEMYNTVKPYFDTLTSTIQTYLVPVFNSLWSLIQQCMPAIKEIIKVAFEAVVISINIAIDIINTAIKVIAGI